MVHIIMLQILVHGEGMRKPVCLAVVGISIVVSAVSLGVTLTRYLGLRAFSPKGATQAAAIPAGRNIPSTPAEEWNNLFAPGDGMKEPKAFREREEIEPGAFLASVEREKVWITRGKEREKLEILPVGSRARPTATADPTVAPPVVTAGPPPASSPGTPARPGTVASPRPSPDRTQAVAAPNASSGAEDEESLGLQERRRRSRGNRR